MADNRTEDKSESKDYKSDKYRGKKKGKKKHFSRDNNRDNNGSRRAQERENMREKAGIDKTNDPAWYAQVPGVAGAGANFNFSVPAGLEFKYPTRNTGIEVLDPETQTEKNTAKYGSDVPAVMAIPTWLVPGIADVTLNSAMFNIYTYVRHENSGHTNYEAQDLMMYLLAVDQIYALYANACRAYGIIRDYTIMDRRLPKAFFKALSLDYDDWSKKAAEVRMRINILAAKINTLAVPNNLPIYARHAFMFSNIYMDGKSNKAQYYMFVPDSYYQFEIDSTTSMGKLTRKGLDSGDILANYSTVEGYFAILEYLLDYLLTDEDMCIMSGDILKAYKGSVCAVAPISVDFQTLPIYSPEVLLQIHNLKVFEVPGNDGLPRSSAQQIAALAGTGDVKQTENEGLNFFPSYSLNGGGGIDISNLASNVVPTFKTVINTVEGFTDPLATMVLTRLCPTISIDPYGGMASIEKCGSEIVTGCFVINQDKNGRDGFSITKIPQALIKEYHIEIATGGVEYDLPPAYDADDIGKLALLNEFAFHPNLMNVIEIRHKKNDEGEYSESEKYLVIAVSETRDLEFYALLDVTDINNTHAIALASEWNLGL